MPLERLSLVGGSYSTRSRIGSRQRCVNLFPEANRKDALSPTTHYQRPGLRPLIASPVGPAPVRCLYRASNEEGYAVIGQGLFQIGANWNLYHLGDLQAGGTAQVSMIDNGTTLFIADGSQTGYTYPLNGAGKFQPIQDPTGSFVGTNKFDYIDGFVIWPGATGNPFAFGSTLANSATFDALYFAAKTNYPDRLVTLKVNRHEILLFGRAKTEVWYDAGNSLFPFAESPGQYIEHGCAAPYSVASEDINTYWLGQDLQGGGVVYALAGYQVKRVSNFALEFAIRKILRAQGNLNDAIGYTYQQDGHTFYVLTFPTADQTWVYDTTVPEPALAWSQRAWSDVDGRLHRERANCHAWIFGRNLVGDWENGTIYELDPDYYVDTVLGTDYPIRCIKTFPEVQQGMLGGQPVLNAGRRGTYARFQVDIETGLAPEAGDGGPARVALRWSDDRGETWGNEVLQSLGAPGEYRTRPEWMSTGTAAGRLFEVEFSAPGPCALNGAFVDVKMTEN